MIKPDDQLYELIHYTKNGKRYLTVDINKKLCGYSVIHPWKLIPDKAKESEFLTYLFPHGISQHGKNYLFNPLILSEEESNDSMSLLTGLIFELVRKCDYPEKPSRYECLFACDNLEDALTFRKIQAKKSAQEHAPIYAVYTKKTTHKGDMNLFDCECSLLELYRRAHSYWKGEPLSHDGDYKPFWEYLLPLPVYVEKKTFHISVPKALQRLR